MIKIIKEGKLTESSLSRLYSALEKYDVAFVTAFKDPAWIRSNYDSDHRLTPREVGKINRERNQELLKDITDYGYTCFKVDGRYENQERKAASPEGTSNKFYTDKEESFAVLNIHNSKKFVQHMMSFAKKFNQESILVVSKGNVDPTFYYMTGEKEVNKKGTFGVDSPFKSLVNGRPFVIESVSDLQSSHIKSSAREKELKEKYPDLFM